MNRYSHVTAEVDQIQGGRATAAFFDFDGTLISSFSVAAFLRRRLLSGRMPPREALEQLFAICNYGLKQIDFADVLTQFALALQGVSDSAMRELADEIFEKDLSADLFPESRALVDAHRAKGHTVILISSATRYQVESAAA